MSQEHVIRTFGIYAPLVTGTLSAMGSSIILYSIWARRESKLQDPQHRILGALSICDLVYSLNKALTFLTYPSGFGVQTFGNLTTCAMQGFFIQFGYAAGSYNPVLSLYYYLAIVRGMKKEQFGQIIEKVLHGVVISCHLSFAIAGVSIGLFNPTQTFCYIAPNPTTGEHKESVPYFYEGFAQVWIQAGFIVVIVTNTLIWKHVREQENKVEKYKYRMYRSQSQVNFEDELAVMKKKHSHAHNVFIQSTLYIGAFMLCWSWVMIYHIIAWSTGVRVPWISVFINIFLPMQGFFNAFIYARPRYLVVREKEPDLGFFEAFKLALIPPDGGNDRYSARSTLNLTREATRSNMVSQA